MSQYQIYHNPRCSKSRQALALLQEEGIDPEIILYLETPPSEDELKSVLRKLGHSPRELLRTSEDAYKEHGLNNPALSDDDLVRLMVANPKLIERPIVIKGKKAVIGRPPENVLTLK